jgi:hypothetical protein
MKKLFKNLVLIAGIIATSTSFANSRVPPNEFEFSYVITNVTPDSVVAFKEGHATWFPKTLAPGESRYDTIKIQSPETKWYNAVYEIKDAMGRVYWCFIQVRLDVRVNSFGLWITPNPGPNNRCTASYDQVTHSAHITVG